MRSLSNRFWFQLHGWFSLPVWVVFCFICLTGTLSVFSHELTWLTNPDARAANPDNLPQITVAEVVSRVEKAYPTAHITGVVVMEPYLVNSVMFTDADKPYAVAYVNPYTGAIQEVNDGNTFINFMRSLHGWLLFPWHHNYSLGYYLVSIMSLVMLGALVTGLVVYKHFWRAFLKPKLRFSQGGRTLLADLHRLSGVWSIWFMLIMSLTGLWYLVQAILWHNDVELEPYPGILPVEVLPLADGKPEQPVSLTGALAITQARYPDFSPSYVMLPEHNRDTYKLSGKGDFVFFDDYSYHVAVNPWTGNIEQTFSPDTMSGLQTVMHLADPLHFGYIGGLWTKALWFVFGVILTGMSITGFMMWYKRLVKSRRQALRPVFNSVQESN